VPSSRLTYTLPCALIFPRCLPYFWFRFRLASLAVPHLLLTSDNSWLLERIPEALRENTRGSGQWQELEDSRYMWKLFSPLIIVTSNNR
jgi:hypothetical protein